MKAIFVSKNNEEYNRYADDVSCGRFCELDISQGKDLPNTHGNSNELPGGDSYNVVVPSAGKHIINDGLEVVVLDGDKLSKKKDFGYGTVTLEDFLSEIVAVVGDAQDALLFVHWGNGGTADNVARIEQKIDQMFQVIGDKKGILSIQSISSRRDAYFKVSAPTQIVPPCTDEEINDLHNKLKRAQKEALPPPYHVGVDIERIEQITDTSISAVNFKVVVVPMSGSPRLAGNDGSGDGFINSLKQWLNKRLGIDVIDLSTLFADTGNASQYVIPLFVYDKWDSKAEQTSAKPSYEKWGLMAPKEFLIEYDEGQECCIFGELENRFKYWAGYEKNFWGADKTRENLRDWLSGTFRKYCFQDEHVHGSGSLMDLHKLDGLQSDIDEFIEHWLLESNPSDKASTDKSLLQGRFISKSPKLLDEMEFLAPVLNVVYRLEIEKIGEAIKHIRETYTTNKEKASLVARIVFRDSTKNDGIPRVVESEQEGKDDLSKVVGGKSGVLYGYKSPGVVVAAKGSAIRFTSLTLKFSVLVVDDKAEEECKRLESIPELKDIFSFDAMELKGESIVQNAIVQFKRLMKSWRTYDFALLDLSLGEKKGSDLYGYQLIRLLHQFFPQMPVIVYSQFSDMGHIARAFRYGAKWFLKKDEAYKLLRHVISILSLRDWRKEWNTVNRLGLCGKIDVRGSKDFTEEQKYLTYRSMEKLPGKDIFVKVMGDGFSSAVTFRARKGAVVDGENLQDPVIIKIDTAFNTMTEYERYFRFIRPYIANESGRVENKEITLDHNNSAITYTFAGKNDSSRVLDTMKNMMAEDVRYMARCDYKKYEAVFDEIFNDILPKIHRVSPKNPNLESPISSYPNRIFGEKDWKDGGFIGNYLARIPLLRSVSVKEFVDQGASGSVPFEMHGVATEGEQKVIETYEIKDPKSGKYEYSKLNVILKGDVVDHVARYRELKQGQTLWVKLLGKDKNDTLTMDSVILDKLIEMLYSKDCKNKDKDGNPTFYDGEKEQTFDLKHDSNTKEEQSRKTFCKLVKTLILGHTPDDGRDLTDLIFDSMVDSMYKTTCDVCAASDSNVRFKCKVGIVHGDLNYANIMVDSKKDGTIEDAKDVWLIDFARTRRDIIAHDFNVIFTATFSQLFNNDLWNDKGIDDNDATRYAARLTKIFPRLIKDAMFAESDEEPDYLYVMEDRRFTLFYKIFRRIRKAALSNDNMTEDMYALTTALCCLYTFKVFLKYEKNIQGAAALLATAYICIKHLEEAKKDRNHNA